MKQTETQTQFGIKWSISKAFVRNERREKYLVQRKVVEEILHEVKVSSCYPFQALKTAKHDVIALGAEPCVAGGVWRNRDPQGQCLMNMAFFIFETPSEVAGICIEKFEDVQQV
jgi:hypothetical protein